jgi:anti-sigma B factor antagonist
MAGEKDKFQNVVKDIKRHGDTVILTLTGEIDMHCSVHVRGELLEIIQEKPAMVIIDMNEVEFMDSSGLAVLVEALQLTRRDNRALKLVGLRPRVRSIFEISRLDNIFQIYNSQAEALA